MDPKIIASIDLNRIKGESRSAAICRLVQASLSQAPKGVSK